MTQTTLPDELPGELATLWYLIRRAASLMDHQGEVLLRRELGISLAQFLVLSVVDAHPGPLSQQAIADRVGLTKGSVSRQIDHAAAAGLMTVRVASHTRRENAVTLTEAGTALVRQGDALTQTSRAAIQDAAGPEDLTAAIRVLRSLLKVLEPLAREMSSPEIRPARTTGPSSAVTTQARISPPRPWSRRTPRSRHR